MEQACLRLCHLKQGPETNRQSTAWVSVRNAEVWAPFQLTESESAFSQDSQVIKVGEGLVWKPTAFHGEKIQAVIPKYQVSAQYTNRI